MHRVFLVDDHEVVRRGIAGLLDEHPALTVVGEASNSSDAVIGITQTLPDVAVLDVHLPDGSGIELCRQIRQALPTVRCLILTAFDDDDALVAAVMGDASGYLLKSLHTDEIVRSVCAVADGESLLNPSMVRRITHRVRHARIEDPRYGSLNLREKQTLALIAEGLTNSQIGGRLGLAEKTVKNYVSSVLSKLGLERRTQAAVLEAERTTGLDSPPTPSAPPRQ